MTARLPDWEARLAEFLAANEHVEFQWGVTDCALWSASAVQEMTGVDPAAAYRGQYDTLVGSAHALREFGEGTLFKSFAAVFPEKPPSFAQRGDLVWYQNAVGVCIGDVALFVSDDGPARIPRHLWERAFKVGA
jgi:hypothetical protein